MSNFSPLQTPGVSGIVEYKPGDRVIPASRRPDGTVRKERKVRPGFVPQEDAARYSNAKIEATKVPAGYVPGLQQSTSIAGGGSGGAIHQSAVDPAVSKAAKKNAKRKAKKVEEGLGIGARVTATDSSTSKPAASIPAAAPSTSIPSAAADAEKKLKALRKKLRQITDIETKESLNDDQRQKIASKPQLEAEVAELEKALSALAV
ncbi:hypothetical protein HDU86_006738 [Geranomyces michiganensis]|nr:hypothetical protein HDU86_006738 [Geranomyces michiganensis]